MTLTPIERDEFLAAIQRRVRSVLAGVAGIVPTAALQAGAVTREKIAGVALMPQEGAYVVGEHYALMSQPSAFSLSATAKVSLATTLYPWVAPRAFTPAELGLYVTTGDAASTCKILVYAHDTATGWPAAKTFESDALDTSTSSTFPTDTTGLPTFTAGTTYWLGVLANGTPTLRSQTTVYNSILAHMATSAATTMSGFLTRTGETYATPTTPWAFAASQLTTGNVPIVIAVA